MRYRNRLAALIACHNDAYTLRFCLDSLPDAIDEVWVRDDASTDGSLDVAMQRRRPADRQLVVMQQTGWVTARNRLLEACDARHVLMLDSDDVLADGALERLMDGVIGGPAPHVRLRLCELWGDLRHTTQRWRHSDPCHVYVDRARVPHMRWVGPVWDRPDVGGVPAAVTDFLVAFHLKGVKPDERLVARAGIREWLGRQPTGLRKWVEERAPAARPSCEEMLGLARLPVEEVHRRAVRFLLTSKIDRPRLAYGEDGTPIDGAPELPRLLRDALPGRFRFVYDGAGHIIDRIDTEREP